MITLTREEAQQVHDALLNFENDISDAMFAALTTLRARLAQPEPEELTGNEKIVYDILCSDETPLNGQHWEGFVAQKIVKALAQSEPEPVAWMHDQKVGFNVPLYTAPPQRKEWQELSDYDVDNIVKASSGRESAVYLAEAKLKEKNT
jgi:hypothetical protein